MRGTIRAWVLLLLLSGSAAANSGPSTWEVRPGDTLWSIAEQAIGDGTLWPALYRANRDQIKDPALVHPGQRLRVPEVAPEEAGQVRREARQLLK
jgi:nucleoid-associated protein YgaU